MRKSTPSYHHKKMFPVKQPPQDRKPYFQRGNKVKKEPSEVVCYGCGTPVPSQGNVITPVKALRRRERPAGIIKPSSSTPANAQKHKGSQNTSSADPWSGYLRGQRGRL
ncbi:hypothetical protein NPIL_556421 [Nephila pilipes]|uniref:Uncharacterized protein n=1 Tax=Nephila pilipes TaxID=299642 RepID=A0A8X6TX21_NEPPI|nr:hypothetical protein NPIL_139191 [Nephila pilipes]GFT87541.1 hypothetical protein NPIL_556421 [Nephila pilipes]